DGAQGLLEMKQNGSPTIGQDAATSVVYGMPKAAFDMGAVDRQFPLQSIAGAIMNRVKGRDIR
ncbi:MAG: chemotaxis protein CheB, partial [Selenomonadaceae bacterium]|nr:chemotaxis protein CheB [Selenomonadaceae bacterium]